MICLTDMSQIFSFILAFFGLFFGMAIVLVYIVNRSPKTPEQPKQPVEQKPKETPMIACQYCATQIPQTASNCPNCGAPNKQINQTQPFPVNQ